MSAFLRVFAGEFRKRRLSYFHSIEVYFATLLWPALELAVAYYMLAPFVSGADPAELEVRFGTTSLPGFLIIGFLGFTLFLGLAESAWRFSFERFEGTLELILLSPASRLAVVMGTAAGGLLSNLTMLVAFLGASFVVTAGWHGANLASGCIALVLLVLTAVCWGAMLNSLLLATRDPDFVFTLSDQPLGFFSGVRFPPAYLGGAAAALSQLIPLTWCVSTLRAALLSGASPSELAGSFGILLLFDVALLAISVAVLGLAERHLRRTGSMSLF